MDTTLSVADRIRTARKQAGLTQQQLASHYDIPLRSLEAWERALRTPPEYLVNLLLRCLEIDFPSAGSTAEQKDLSAPSSPKTTMYTDTIGRPLKEPVLSAVMRAYADGKVQDLGNSTVDYDGNYRPDPKGRLYRVLEPENYGLDMGLTFYVQEV